MKVRRLNKDGVEIFIEFLDSLTPEKQREIPFDLLNSSKYSIGLEDNVDVEMQEFSNRYDAAEYLIERFDPKLFLDVEYDKGMWAWLSLFYFEILCPINKKGYRKPGELARWIPAIGNYQKYLRHLLLGPYRIFLAHRDNPERALALLVNPVHQPGEIAEQLSQYKQIVTNPAIVEAATLLFIDKNTKSFKRGAAGKGAGSARRIEKFWKQFDVTWDLYGMTTDEILELLPSEFDKWRGN